MESCEAGVLAETGCRAQEKYTRLQGHCTDQCYEQVVRLLCYDVGLGKASGVEA